MQGQNPPSPPAKEAQIESKGLPPRATPADYQAHVQAGAVTIAAEFAGHSVPTAQGPLTTEDFVVVEMGLFGAPDARLRDSRQRLFAPHQREEGGLAHPAVRDGAQFRQGSRVAAA